MLNPHAQCLLSISSLCEVWFVRNITFSFQLVKLKCELPLIKLGLLPCTCQVSLNFSNQQFQNHYQRCHLHCWVIQYILYYKRCVRSYANSTTGPPILFGVLPLVPLTYHWLQTFFTTGSIFCRRSGAWAKRTAREVFVIKMEGLKNFRAETSGITTIFPIQMTLNNKIYVINFWWPTEKDIRKWPALKESTTQM